MSKTMKYKVGDKIKVVTRVWWIDRYYTNKVGTVIDIDSSEAFYYTIDIDTIKIPVDECEIEKASVKGEQLVFEFML